MYQPGKNKNCMIVCDMYGKQYKVVRVKFEPVERFQAWLGYLYRLEIKSV